MPQIPHMPPQIPQIPQAPQSPHHHHNWQPQPVVINYTQPYYDGGLPLAPIYLAPEPDYSALITQLLNQPKPKTITTTTTTSPKKSLFSHIKDAFSAWRGRAGAGPTATLGPVFRKYCCKSPGYDGNGNPLVEGCDTKVNSSACKNAGCGWVDCTGV